MEVAMLTIQRTMKILDNVSDLPTLPTVYTKVSKLVENPNSTVAQVAKVIEADQAITAKVLRLVNSSFFGFSRKISTVNQAIILLGFNTIRNTVLSVSMFNSFRLNKNGMLNLSEFWRHSIGCGLISGLLEVRLNADLREEAFAAGILHDIGKLVLDRYFPNEFIAALKHAQTEQCQLREAEKVVIGVSHDEVGEYLAERWRLPHKLVEAIALHHLPSNFRSSPKLVSIVHIANIFVQEMQIGQSGDCKVPEIDPFALEELGVDEDTINGWYVQIQEEIKENQDLFEIIS
ncbi:HD family phosphohydrolase [candidate division KSB1 bacterium]|nr:MAG: hypothetical protein B5M50_05885 [candidate division KSB1 bacterium 4484_219]RKY80305.1 MAG: HD family phosphohydrolase [candidate division KSB1 bacterium]RKY80531.1 MAG: HD family phosphohydrolase [candidate division KSB1 bacterium]RKY86082.1 MAG: HD family phosphohydrolase [candidate division KSB1 bacterium]RKY87846.1 MAG: HD family phosphohydrolase [candidate division KSB1 bacterium]